MNIFIFLGSAFLIIFLTGHFLEKIKIPWIFAALFLGLILSSIPGLDFQGIERSDSFIFLAELGMYFLLFLIGYELDIVKIKKLGSFIMKATFFIIISEAIMGGLLIHFVFDYSWFVSMVVALSFATVGEAVLVPILEEFKLTKAKLGQSILGIGTFDDTIEIFLILLVVFTLPFMQPNGIVDMAALKHDALFAVGGLLILLILTLGITNLKNRIRIFKFTKIEGVFFLTIAIFFIFLGIADIAGKELVALGAILSGMSLGNYLPEKRKEMIEKDIKVISYGFLAPIFFLWVGMETDVSYLLSSPLLIVLVILVSFSAKILASIFISRNQLSFHESAVLGVALGVRFSTSIVIIKFLFQNSVIDEKLYSVLIGSTIAAMFFVPFLLSYLIRKWKLTPLIDIGFKQKV